MDIPFKIGQTYWAPRHHAERVTLPCPACKGTRIVTIIYGDEHVSVDCEACGKGFEGPQGAVIEYDFTPLAEQFVIASVDSLYNGEWSVRSETGQTSRFSDLCTTEAEALERSKVKCVEQHESNMRSRMHGRSRAANATWSIGYHKKCIKDLERQIAWHTARINAGKVTKEKA